MRPRGSKSNHAVLSPMVDDIPEPSPEDDDKAQLTGVGCVLVSLSLAVIFGVALPIVQWRDPATGRPLPRMVAIVSPILIGAVFQAIVTLLLKLIGIRVWSKPDKGESSGPET
jgi:hypothetical protein